MTCTHHFITDLINKMDHMRISGTEPSSMILSQRKKFQKFERDTFTKRAKTSWSEKDSVINLQN